MNFQEIFHSSQDRDFINTDKTEIDDTEDMGADLELWSDSTSLKLTALQPFIFMALEVFII
jgi:hypothetical protein